MPPRQEPAGAGRSAGTAKAEKGDGQARRHAPRHRSTACTRHSASLPSSTLHPARARRHPSGSCCSPPRTVGFAFFLMELVWYRLLAPLLGGSVFTFGLVLAVALAGIGLGGLVVRAARERQAGVAVRIRMDLPDRSLRRRRHLRARRPHRLSRGDAAADRDDRVRRAHRRMDDRHGRSSCFRPRSSPAISSRCSSRCSAARAKRIGAQIGRAYAANTLGRDRRVARRRLRAAAVAFGDRRVAIRRDRAAGPRRGGGDSVDCLGTPPRDRPAPDADRPAPDSESSSARRSSRSSRLSSCRPTGPTAVWRHSGIGAGRVAPAAGVRLAEPLSRLGRRSSGAASCGKATAPKAASR